MKTHKFARKTFYVDAVRVTELNMEEVAVWCGGSVMTSEGVSPVPYVLVKVKRPLDERQTQAFVGDWVLSSGRGFKVYVPKAFEKSFEKVRTLTKAQADAAGIKPPHEPKAVKSNFTPSTIRKKDVAPPTTPTVNTMIEPPRSMADVEVDRLIAEVNGRRSL